MKKTDRQNKSWLYAARKGLERTILKYVAMYEKDSITFGDLKEFIVKSTTTKVDILLSRLNRKNEVELMNTELMNTEIDFDSIKHTKSVKKHKIQAKEISDILQQVYDSSVK